MPGLAGGGNGERFPGLVIFGGLPQIQSTSDGVIPCPIIRLGPCAKVSWLTHLIHRIFLKVKGIHNSYIMNNGARAISLLARPRFRPYLSGAGG